MTVAKYRKQLKPAPKNLELSTRQGRDGKTYDTTNIGRRAIIRDDPEALAAWREAMKEQGKRNDLVDNVNEVTADKGNSRSYTVSRLQKQRPDLFERVKAGERRKPAKLPTLVMQVTIR